MGEANHSRSGRPHSCARTLTMMRMRAVALDFSVNSENLLRIDGEIGENLAILVDHF